VAAETPPVAEGRPEDLPGIDYDRPGDVKRKQPSGEHNPYPFSPEEDDDYFREIFRKKREAAKQQGMAEGLHPMVIDDVKKLATLNPVDRYSAYANIRGYFKDDPELSKMASDLQGGYYEADMLRSKYKTDAAKAKYAELEPMHQAFIKQALGQEQGMAEDQLDEIGDTPAGRAALGAVEKRADDIRAAWSANPKSGYSSTPKDVSKATSATIAASNRLHGFGPDRMRQDTVMARDALRQKQGMAEGLGYSQDPAQAKWYHEGRKAFKGGTTGNLIQDIAKKHGVPEEWIDAFHAGYQDQEGFGKDPVDEGDNLATFEQDGCNQTMEGQYCPEHGLAECGGMYESQLARIKSLAMVK
jgi:hypothetical protein